MPIAIVSYTYGLLSSWKCVLSFFQDVSELIIYAGGLFYLAPRNPLPEGYHPPVLADKSTINRCLWLSTRETVEERVLRPSVNKVIAYGTANVVSRGGNTLRYRRVFQARATAYGPSAGKYTATGAKAGRGSIAVDPRVIPLGTRLYVDGYGHGTANDVGGEIKGNAVDVYFPSDAECRRWGVRTVNVYILE
jgi:3D (Asp-Asp-Asp) domain-containing protein